MIPWLRIAAVLAALGTVAGVGWHYRATVAERDALRGRIEAAEASAARALSHVKQLQEDAVHANRTAEKLEQDRAAVSARLADALRRVDGLRVIADLGARESPPSADAGSGHGAAPCGLSGTDAADLDRRLVGIRAESLRLAADADAVVGQLAACQAEVRRLGG